MIVRKEGEMLPKTGIVITYKHGTREIDGFQLRWPKWVFTFRYKRPHGLRPIIRLERNRWGQYGIYNKEKGKLVWFDKTPEIKNGDPDKWQPRYFD